MCCNGVVSVELRETVAADVEAVLALESDPAAAAFVEAWPAELHLAALCDPNVGHLQVVEDDRRVGFAILTGLRDPNDCVELRRIVVSPPGRGLGRAALTLVLDHVFGPLGAHRVWLDVKPATPGRGASTRRSASPKRASCETPCAPTPATNRSS